MDLPWTHEVFSYDPCSLNYSAVEAGQQDWTIQQTHEMFSLFPQLLSSLSSLTVLNFVQLVKTHDKLSYDSISLNYCVVQAVKLGWTTSNWWKNVLQSLFIQVLGNWSCSDRLNYPELMKSNPIIMFIQLLSSSNSSACFYNPKHIRHYPMILLALIAR